MTIVFHGENGGLVDHETSGDAQCMPVDRDSLKKRRSNDQTFRNDKRYNLCFPDGSKVTTLPGTKKVFTLEISRKTYARISFLLCPLKDALDSEPEQTCWTRLDLEFESDEWLGDVDRS